VASTKSRNPIAAADIPRTFDDSCINELADIGQLPAGADRKRLAEGIREAARIYAKDARTPTDNKLHAEITALYRAAAHKRCLEVADFIEKLSPKARELLRKRATRLCLEVPAPEVLRDPAQQKACDTVLKLCQYGGKYGEGRRRDSGKRSRTWWPLLIGPKPSRNFARRDAERNFIMCLQLAWLEATGAPPSRAAKRALNREISGPFARMAEKSLRLVGARADAVGLINELNRRRIQRPPRSRKLDSRSRPKHLRRRRVAAGGRHTSFLVRALFIDGAIPLNGRAGG
jgi:hypothetical protein